MFARTKSIVACMVSLSAFGCTERTEPLDYEEIAQSFCVVYQKCFTETTYEDLADCEHGSLQQLEAASDECSDLLARKLECTGTLTCEEFTQYLELEGDFPCKEQNDEYYNNGCF